MWRSIFIYAAAMSRRHSRRPIASSRTPSAPSNVCTCRSSPWRGDARVRARRCDVWWNGGAYADIGPRVTQKSGFTAAGPYDIENVATDSSELYTNRPPAGALRGFGIPQLVWAYESHTDLLARALGIDPLAFRRQNILREGRPQATGTVVQDAAVAQVLDALAAGLNLTAPLARRWRTRPVCRTGAISRSATYSKSATACRPAT